MKKFSLLVSTLTVAASLSACVEATDDPIPDDPAAADPAALEADPAAGEATLDDIRATFLNPWSAPKLKWILHATPGTARLARRAAAGPVSVLATHTFATHWRAVSVAGNKLLWQRTDTGEVSLWTIDNNGAYQRHVYLAPPGAGWRAVSIALSDDGACPAPILDVRTYVITFEGPAQFVNRVLREPAPILWTVDDDGVFMSGETLPDANGLFTTLRDFRPSLSGRWALLSAPTSVNQPFAITYYQRIFGSLMRLRTDSYTAAAGLIGCVLHPAGVGLTSCATDFTDRAPGAGFEPTSFQFTQDTFSNNMANTLLWSRTDGTSSVFALEPLGQQANAPTSLTPSAAPYRAVSLGGYDESPGFGLLCDHRPPPIPRPGDFDPR